MAAQQTDDAKVRLALDTRPAKADLKDMDRSFQRTTRSAGMMMGGMKTVLGMGMAMTAIGGIGALINRLAGPLVGGVGGAVGQGLENVQRGIFGVGNIAAIDARTRAKDEIINDPGYQMLAQRTGSTAAARAEMNARSLYYERLGVGRGILSHQLGSSTAEANLVQALTGLTKQIGKLIEVNEGTESNTRGDKVPGK